MQGRLQHGAPSPERCLSTCPSPAKQPAAPLAVEPASPSAGSTVEPSSNDDTGGGESDGSVTLPDSDAETTVMRRAQALGRQPERGSGAWCSPAWCGSLRQGSRGSAQALRQRQVKRRAMSHGAARRNQYFGTELAAPLAPPRTPSHITGSRCRSSVAMLHVYDLKGTTGVNDTTLGFGMGLFHAGVEVCGVEWSFGYIDAAGPVSGVYPWVPRKCPIGAYRESLPLGKIRAHSARDVWRLVGRMAGEWLGTDYQPLKRNCLDFCNEFCRHLHVQELPVWIGRLATVADVLFTPLLESLNIGLVPPPRAIAGGRCEGGSQAAALREPLSTVAAVSLDFERKHGWALECMVAHEARLLPL